MASSGRINQTQLATMAGVSRATVSRALANHPSISSPVSTRIKLLARKLNYRPNAAARSFVTRRNNTIGMVLCDRALTASVYARLSSSVENAVREAGLKMQLSLHDSEGHGREQLPPIFQDDGIDGVVLAGAVPNWLLNRLANWRMPFVLLSTQQGMAGINQVAGDPYRGGQLIAEYLLSLGHRRIGLLLGPRARQMHAEYFEGFQNVCLQAGLDKQQIEASVVECLSNDVIKPMQTLLRRMADVTAIFADTDLVAWQVVQYLRTVGRSVPQQVSVAGAGDTLGMFKLDLKLTTVDVRLGEMGRVAVQLLREVIENTDASSRRIVIDPVVTPRNTTAPPPNHRMSPCHESFGERNKSG